MPLPFIAESVDSLKKRYSKCIEKTWTLAEVNSGNRPGLHRDYVFDFESGLRLLISKSVFFPNSVDVHISASWEHDIPLNIDNIIELNKQIEQAFHSIGGEGKIRFLGMSANFIPHWLVINDKRN